MKDRYKHYETYVVNNGEEYKQLAEKLKQGWVIIDKYKENDNHYSTNHKENCDITLNSNPQISGTIEIPYVMQSSNGYLPTYYLIGSNEMTELLYGKDKS